MFWQVIPAVFMAFALAKGEIVRGRAFIKPNCKQAFAYKVFGSVKISQKAFGGKTTFHVQLEGLPPNSVHGFHVHEKGDIFTNGCKSTGGHYNPFGVVHGGKDDKIRHVGDLGNLKADAKGKVDITFSDRMAGLAGQYSIAGRAFVVHAGIDDLGRGIGKKKAGSQKTGNAGSRVACGIIYFG